MSNNKWPSDELYHFKYIKRERKNGRWKYYYDHAQLKDDLGIDDYKRFKQAESKDIAARQEYKNAASKEIGVYDQLGNHQASARYVNAAKNRRKAGQEYVQAKSDFVKTPVGKLYTASKKVGGAVNKFLKKVFNIR